MKIDELIPIVKDNMVAKGIPIVSDVVIKQEIDEAIFTINECRRFTPTDGVLYDKRYESLIVPLCISALAKIGAEGQTAHSENNINRTYGSDGKYPISLLRTIKPLIK